MRSSTHPPYTDEIIVGADKSPFLDVEFSKNVLFIDDGPLSDQLDIPARRKDVEFDVSKHYLNPLKGMDYRRARDFIAVLDAVFPEGANTLTRKNSNFVLLEALLDKPTYLYRLLKPDKKDPAKQDAYQKIQTLLMSPVLSAVLCNAKNFSMNGIVLARLDRAKLGDFDAFVLGSLLISMFDGQMIVPDFGFYGRDHHISLIRQGRLIAGVTTLSEVSTKLQQALLTIPDKVATGATFEDATTLANYEGLRPDPTRQDNPYNRFINEAMQ